VKRPLLHLGLFLATCCTSASCYHFFFGGRWPEAALFAITALFILGSHEFGHWAMARRYGVETSLPYFLPAPIGFGTFGAVIRIRGRIPSRNALVDIGAAGPLLGLMVALPLLALGMAMTSRGAQTGWAFPDQMSLISAVRGLLRWVGSGRPPEMEQRIGFGSNLLSLMLDAVLDRRDRGGAPILIGAWFGMLVTMLNLIPIGQLDGGHLTHAWFGPRAVTFGKMLAVGMAFLALFYSAGWALWLLITTRVIGFKHPQVSQPSEPLSASRKLVCAVCFVCFALTLMPVPMTAS
jgi:membrane-associated protease RseP (regulator of RpoE activity)